MVFSNNLLLGGGGQSTGPSPFVTTLIGNSVWLDGSADFLSAELGAKTRTKAVIGTWIQKTGFSNSDATIFSKKGSAQFAIRMQDQSSKAGKISIFDYDGSANQYEAESTSMLLRDNGWYHIMISIDTTAIAGNRLRYYINGIDQTDTLTITTDYTASDNPSITGGTGEPTQWGVGYAGNNQFNPCYLAQSFMLDDDSIQNGDVAVTDILAAFTLGTNGSQFTPKSDAAIAALATTAGGDSFCLDFSNSGSLGLDSSTPANNFTPTDMSSANQSTNTPSKNYSIFNPLSSGDTSGTGTFTLSNGNRTAVLNSSNTWIKTTVPFVMSGSNIIRTQFTIDAVGDSAVGITGSPHTSGTYHTSGLGIPGRGEVILLKDGSLVVDGNFGGAGYTSAFAAADVIDVIVNLNVGAVWFALNGTLGGSATQSEIQAGTTTNAALVSSFVSRTAGEVFNFYAVQYNPSSPTFTYNSGQSSFAHSYSSITDLVDLNTADLTAPTYQGIDYFTPTLYEGNGTGQRVGDFVPVTDTYTVTNSVMFEDADSRSLTLNSSATRTSATVAAFSLWTKRANLGTNQRPLTVQVDSNNYFSIYYDTSDQLDFTINNGGSTILQRITTRAFKDTSAWHNIVVIINQGNGTQADRVKVFYDGVQIPNTLVGFGTNTCTLDGSSALNFLDSASAVNDVGGGSSTGFTQTYDGYVSEVAFLDGADSGAKLNASDFGQVDTSTNRWTPKDIGSYDFGNTGYYLEFKVAPGTSNGAGTDTSGESNNFTSNGSWATSDQFTDSPSKNFTTFDSGYSGGGSNVWSEGNTKVKGTDGSLSDSSTTTFGMTGKVVFQFQMNTVLSGYPQVGFITSQTGLAAINAASGSIELGTASVPGSFAYTDTGTFKVPGGTESTAFSPVTGLQALDADDVIRFEVDTSAGTMRAYFQNEGTGSFSEITGARVDNFSFDPSFGIRPAVSNYNNSIVTLQTGGQTTLASVTTAYKEINQDNLDDTQSKITAWAWIKNRDATDNHMLFDRIRGVNNDIHSNDTAIEEFNANTVQRFLQRGVQVGSDVEVNTANESYVLWQWLLGDSATTGTVIPASGSNPTLASTSLASDNGSFGICTYTGDATAGSTVKHSLDGIPEMILFKRYGATTANWMAYHKDAGASNTDYLLLDNTAAKGAFGAINWLNATTPTSTLVTLGSDSNNNAADKFIMYLFRSIAGVCKVGSYTGSGDANGPYISTGFEPSFIMIKRAVGGAGDWNILDTSREPFNAASPLVIRANLPNAGEAGSIGDFDILSDGFKLRAASANANTASSTYIYLAMSDIGGNGTLPPMYGR